MLPDRRQLPLPFPDAQSFDARDFIPAGSNRHALAWLDAEWPDRRLAISGPAGCGKSHLLHAWTAGQAGTLIRGSSLAALEVLPEAGALAIDDADLVMPETLLLHTLNTARDRGLRLLLSARLPPARWPVHLPDLGSRLRAITAVEIGAPGDDLLAALLVRLFAERQILVPASLHAWLLARLPRSAGALQVAVDRLNRASLATGRPVSRAMAEAILSDLIGPADEIPMADDAARLH